MSRKNRRQEEDPRATTQGEITEDAGAAALAAAQAPMLAVENAEFPQRRRTWQPLWSELLAGLEWAALKVSPVYYGVGVPQGDGAPIILVPGFLGSDLSLLELHLWLGRMGYRSYSSGIGLNADCPDVLLERLCDTIARVYRETGRKVRLIGHSQGGLLAQAAAVRMPERVAQLITMGTPSRRPSAHPMVLRLMKRVLRRRRETPRSCMRMFFAALRECMPASVARVSVYSKADAVVDWRDCVGVDGVVNIQVSGTHIGMSFNPQVYREIAGLLASHQDIEEPLSTGPLREPDLALAA